MATLLRQVPAAAKYKSKLQAMEKELLQLRSENAALRDDLAQYIEQWETLDGPQVSTLQYLAANSRGHAREIARSVSINIQIAETSLLFLCQHNYVRPDLAAGKATRGKPERFALSAKGERYLRSRGLHK